MRTTSSVENFPWYEKQMCYIEVKNDGSTEQIDHIRKGSRSDALAAVGRAKKGDSKIYVAWPGRWETGLFYVDDLTALYELLLN